MWIRFNGPQPTSETMSNYEMLQIFTGTKGLPVGQSVERVDSKTVKLLFQGRTIAYYHRSEAANETRASILA